MNKMWSVDLKNLQPPKPDLYIVPQKARVSFDPFEPQSLEEFIGQESAKAQIRLELEAAKRDDRPLRHIFLYGPPGTGKTTIVKLIAVAACNAYLYETTGSQYATPDDVINMFADYETWPVGTLWLLDETSEMGKSASTVFHAPMTQRALLWKGMRRTNPHIEHMVLCATTNYVAKSPGAYRDRFDLQIKLGYYSPQELALVARQVATRLGVEVDEDAARYLGQYAAGTPRQLNRLMRTAVAICGRGGRVSQYIAESAASKHNIFAWGLVDVQVQYLMALSRARKKTIGKNALAALLVEDSHTLEDVLEPYLLFRGLVTITGSGRCLTDMGEAYLEVIK